MKVTNKIDIHLDDYRIIPEIVVMQCDANTRELEFSLYVNNAGWQPPAPGTAKYYVSYRKPDGKGGFYDTLPDGSDAYTVGDGNTLAVILAPQVLTTPGKVPVSVTIQQGEQVLSTFTVQLKVKPNPGIGAVESKDYFCIQAAIDAAVVAAQKPVQIITVSKDGDDNYQSSHDVSLIQSMIDNKLPFACYWYEKGVMARLADFQENFAYSFTVVSGTIEYNIAIIKDRGVVCAATELAKAADIPQKTSDLQNDSGFLTKAPVSSVNGQTGDVHIPIPDKVSQLANDMGYLSKIPVTSVNGQTGDVNLPTPLKITLTKKTDGSYDTGGIYSEEIVKANDNGRVVYCQNVNRVLPLIVTTVPQCIFGCVHAGYIHTVTITTQSVSVASTPLSTGGGSGDGADGITPHIGDNGNWFIGETDTGMPSRGEVGPTGVHVGPDAPEDDAVHVWVDTDEDSNAELPSGGDGGYYTPVITQTEAGKAEFSWTASKAGMPAVASQSVTLPAGPQGPQGEKGATGADGKEGPQGEPGEDGKSAYQYALDGGYNGTEEEFAEKLAADLPTGGSDSGKWMLDAEVETTEQVTEITVDLHPIPSSIKRCGCRIFIYVPRPTQGEEQQSITAYLNGTALFSGDAVSNSQNYAQYTAEIHDFYGTAQGWYTVHGAGLGDGMSYIAIASVRGEQRTIKVASKTAKLLPVGVRVRAEYYVMEDAV